MAVDATDTDLDGLSDGFEAAIGTDGQAGGHGRRQLDGAHEQSTGLDPTAIDTDTDGVVDDADMDPDTALVVGGGGTARLAGHTAGHRHHRRASAPPPRWQRRRPWPAAGPTPVVAPPPEGADALTRTFLDHALAQTGDSYVFGAEAPTDDADPGVFDCSELVQWSAGQVGIEMPDGSWLQYLELKEAGAVIPVEQAATTPGRCCSASTASPPPAGAGQARRTWPSAWATAPPSRPGAARYGVGSGETGDRFQYAAVIPGLGTTPGAGGRPTSRRCYRRRRPRPPRDRTPTGTVRPIRTRWSEAPTPCCPTATTTG